MHRPRTRDARRAAAPEAETGEITLNVRQRNEIAIELADDGSGLDLAHRSKARARRVAEDVELTEARLIECISPDSPPRRSHAIQTRRQHGRGALRRRRARWPSTWRPSPARASFTLYLPLTSRSRRRCWCAGGACGRSRRRWSSRSADQGQDLINLYLSRRWCGRTQVSVLLPAAPARQSR